MKRLALWALLLPIAILGLTQASAQLLLDPSTLTKYIDPLPQPLVRTPTGTYRGQPLYDVYLKQAKAKIHTQLDSTPVFTFDGSFPGPTFLVQSGHPQWVFYHNNLPQHHLFNVDTMIPVMMGMGFGDKSRFVAHLHGGDVESQYDGWCMDAVPPGQTLKYKYPNSQRAATLWYHDHSCGITRLNAYAGIAGFYIIIDPYERGLGLPAGAHELGIALQDRTFYQNGQLYYPEMWQAEYFGDVAVVNGKAWPKLEVDPAKYRIHFLAGGNDRFWNVKLLECNSAGVVPPESLAGPGIYQIGSDQGLLPNTVLFKDPAPANGRLLMEPGARYDVVIDFAGQRGKYFLVHNNASAPFDGTFPPDPENPLPECFLIHVKDTTYVDNARLPLHFITPRRIPEYRSSYTRDWDMSETLDSMGMSTGLQLNHRGFMQEVMNGIVDSVKLGSTEIWRYINTTMDMHPMHIHLVAFNILDKTPFDVNHYKLTGQVVFTGPAEPPVANEQGWKDEVMSPPGYVSRVIAKYTRLGKYVTHCHILGHEENDMMQGFVVVPHWRPGGTQDAADVPIASGFAQNTPELFRDHMSISFSLPVRQDVRLAVYDVLGREVKTLAKGNLGAGLQTFVWDGTDASGAQVAAGVYYYKLQTSEDTETQRATLLR